MTRMLSVVAAGLCYVSVVALLLAMGVVGVDVTLRAATNRPILGSTDIVEFLFSVVLFCALPATFLARRHIVVDIIDLIAPPRLVKLLVAISSVLCVFLLTVMTWQLLDPVSYMYATGEATLNIELPKWMFGAVAFLGLSVSVVMEAFSLFAKPGKPREPAPATQ